MKRFLLVFFLLTGAASLFANDDGAEYMPDYRELVRQGYGPRLGERPPASHLVAMVAKPTQAFYGKGYAIYYGYTAIPEVGDAASRMYAFGYPADYSRRMTPGTLNGGNLSDYAVEVRRPTYRAGEYVAENQAAPARTVTRVRNTNTVATATARKTDAVPAIATTVLPIAEKTGHQ